MKALIVASGLAPGTELLQEKAAECDYIIAVDGGLAPLYQAEILPDLIVGDMDSVDNNQLNELIEKGSECSCAPAEKNETDSFLALETACERGADEVVILGATGGRLDHLLSNIMLLKWAHMRGIKIRMEDDAQTVDIHSGTFEIYGKKGQTVSILPVDACAVVTAQGLYYPLEELELTNSRPRGISNLFVEKCATISTNCPVLIITIK